ncbi:MAG: Glyoxylate/hydroxypyruvate reductase A [Paracidovorax wautersii]|uniref:Glyoxylate/hydroxypyruvate reductase A n=1 Tax=Paracidovorax wautersii TaxID=1177982 RepID=A0A7V8JPU2_9BURK|nr:MAG: Glyoxylate/hydroxypyruvate reductase A [Paracidovorax wautersii]
MTGMHILLCLQGLKAEPWVEGLQAALPDATVSIWQPGAGQPPADYAVVWQPPQALLDEQPGLKALFNIGAGVDALVKLRVPPHTRIVRLDDAGMSVQMAEYVCQAVIRHFRELDAHEATMDQGRWAHRRPRLRADYPVGVMGLGVLGSRVARALTAFEFAVNGWSRSPRAVDGVRGYAGEAQLDDFLRASHILVCLLPLTPETEDILNHRTLGALRPGGYLVNVARGRHLVEADLLALLDEGHLAGATLDVFREEPLPAGHPFWSHPKLVLTPHTSAMTLRDDSIAQIVGKMRALAQGRPVAGLVDLDKAY